MGMVRVRKAGRQRRRAAEGNAGAGSAAAGEPPGESGAAAARAVAGRPGVVRRDQREGRQGGNRDA